MMVAIWDYILYEGILYRRQSLYWPRRCKIRVGRTVHFRTHLQCSATVMAGIELICSVKRTDTLLQMTHHLDKPIIMCHSVRR